MKMTNFLSKLTPAQKKTFAEVLGIERVYLSQIAGGAVPSPVLARRIQTETSGLVTVYDLRADAHEIWPVQSSPPVCDFIAALVPVLQLDSPE